MKSQSVCRDDEDAAHLSKVGSCLVRTRFRTHNRSGLSGAGVGSPIRAVVLTSGVSKARTGEIVLKGV